MFVATALDIMELKTLKGLALQDILLEIHAYVHRSECLNSTVVSVPCLRCTADVVCVCVCMCLCLSVSEGGGGGGGGGTEHQSASSNFQFIAVRRPTSCCYGVWPFWTLAYVVGYVLLITLCGCVCTCVHVCDFLFSSVQLISHKMFEFTYSPRWQTSSKNSRLHCHCCTRSMFAWKYAETERGGGVCTVCVRVFVC